MRNFIFLLFLGFLASCSGLEDQVTTDDLGFKQVYTIDPETGRKQGEYREYNPDDQLVELAHYHQDVLVGQRLLYGPAGDVQVREEYLNQDFKVAKDMEDSQLPSAVFSGAYEVFYDTENRIKIRGQYIDGAMNGEWLKYYENGQSSENVTFVDNQENGPFKEWHENGKLKATGHYLNGDQEHGEIRLFDESGTLERILQCNTGRCQTSWRVTDGTPAPAPVAYGAPGTVPELDKSGIPVPPVNE